AGAAEQVEQPGQGIHDQPDQGAEGLTEPFEGVGIYMHRSASGSVSGQGVTIAEVGGWSEGRCWLLPSLTPDPSPAKGRREQVARTRSARGNPTHGLPPLVLGGRETRAVRRARSPLPHPGPGRCTG